MWVLGTEPRSILEEQSVPLITEQSLQPNISTFKFKINIPTFRFARLLIDIVSSCSPG